MSTQQPETDEQSETAIDPSAIIQQDTLDDWLDVLQSVADEAKIHTDPDGLHVRAVDPANVAMIDTTLSAETGSSAFEAYEFAGGTIGVNLERLQDLINVGDTDDLVHLVLDEETRKLRIEIGSFEATMALIDPDSIRQEPDIPDLDLSSEVVVEGSWLDKAIDAADLVSDHIAFGCNEDKRTFYVEAEGDTDDVRLEPSDDEVIAASAGDAHSLFSLDYADDLISPVDSDAEVQVDLGQEFPMKWHWDAAEGSIDTTAMVAPRIQSE